jgi:DNA-directed RNA polymerase specialized sigma24 family protein
MDDFDNIEEFKKGNASAFEGLLLKYKDRIYTVCRYLLENPHDADDAAGTNFLDTAPSQRPSPESDYETEQALHSLQASLNRLSGKLRIPLVLKEVEGLSYEEIAAALDVSVGTVKSRISRAREEMARRMTIPRNKSRGETFNKSGEKP